MVQFSMRFFKVEYGHKTNLKARRKVLKKRYISFLSLKSSFDSPSKDQNIASKKICVQNLNVLVYRGTFV